MSKYTIEVFLLTLLLCTCSNNNTKRQVQYVFNEPTLKIDTLSKPIVFDLKSDINTDFYDKMLDSVKLIQLETTDESIFGSIGSIKYIDDKFFVADNLKTQIIFVFDKHGKFIYKIGSIGQGPGEYSSMNQVEINHDGVFIFDWISRKYVHYDLYGRFINESIIPFNVAKVIGFKDGNYIFQYQYYKKDKAKYRISVVDSVFNEINTALPFTNTRKFVPGSFVNIKNNSCYYYYPLCDTIFEINNHKIIPKFHLSLYERGEIDNFIEDTKYLDEAKFTEALWRSNKSKIVSTFDFEELSDYYYVRYQIQVNSAYISLLNKKSGKSNNFIQANYKKNNFYIPFRFEGVFNNTLIGYIDNSFVEILNSKVQKEFYKLLKDKKDIEKINNIGDKNPILVLFYLKKG